MKNKILKLILIVFVILIILFAVNLLRNYIITKDIIEYSLGDNISNFYFKYETTDKSSDNKVVGEYYYKDGILLEKLVNLDEEIINWYNFNTSEYETTVESSDEEIIDYDKEYENTKIYELSLLSNKYTIKDILLNYMFKPITSEDNCYKLTIDDKEYYINKDTKLIEKSISSTEKTNEYVTQESTETVYEFKIDVVTDTDVEKPSLD